MDEGFGEDILLKYCFMLPEAKHDKLQNVIGRNVFSDDSSSKPDDAASPNSPGTAELYLVLILNSRRAELASDAEQYLSSDLKLSGRFVMLNQLVLHAQTNKAFLDVKLGLDDALGVVF
ncbi:hypothetical protein PanWU01x14_155350 [Parasponia andersonii]|uniref:Uncharacterized protein n=1 Tax=Parasponia andersonii TaxID=3476 RepID=A0A2P5CG52_PARAD|nr:hypothetical protein PanWU01x14_155350 [Parasponia andersonii]